MTITSNYLFDTNIISELGRPEPQKNVVNFVASAPIVWLSTITLHELSYGIALIPQKARQHAIQQVVSELIKTYGDYILPVGEEVAQAAARLRVTARQQGRTLHLADALIAGTAKVHGLTVVTRNVKDFKGLDVPVLNPF